MDMRKISGVVVLLTAMTLLAGCGKDVSKAYASDKTIGVEDFFKMYHVSENGTLLWIDECDSNILYDSDGKEYFEVDGDDYVVQVLATKESLNPKKIIQGDISTTGNVSSIWIGILEEKGIDYKSLVNIEEEKYISVSDVLNCFRTIDIDINNFWDYFEYEIKTIDEEFAPGVVKPKKQKVLHYIGNDKLITDFSSYIDIEGIYDYSMSLNIYDSNNELVSQEENYYYNTEDYSRSFDICDMGSVYFPNTLEYWTYRDLDGQLSQYINDAKLELTSANGKLLVLNSYSFDGDWNTAHNGEQYLAVKLDDGTVVRYFKNFGVVNPSDFSLQEKSFFDGFSATLSLEQQIEKTFERIVNNCEGYSSYENLSRDEIIDKYKREYSFSFGNLKALGNFSIDDF